MPRPPALRLALLFMLACALAPAATALPLEWLPADSPFYRELELLRAEGLLDTTAGLDTRPMARADAARLTAFALLHHPERAAHPGLVRLHREFSRELTDLGFPAAGGYTPPLLLWAPGSAEPAAGPGHAGERLRVIPYLDGALERRADGRGRLADRSRAGLRLGVELGPVLLHQDLFAGRLDGARAFADPLVEGTDFVHYTEDTYASARLGVLDLSLGRMRHGWGPGAAGTLLWSRTADPVTHLLWAASLFGGRVRGTAVHADVDAAAGERLAAHRVELSPAPGLTVGLAEAARYTSAQWEPLYVVSVVPFTLVQRMLAQDRGADTLGVPRNNVMVSADARWRLRPGVALYGEVLLDDLTFKKRGTPVRVGYLAGAQGVAALGHRRLHGRAEWARVHRYVYSVFYGEDFVHHDRPVGYPAGPDSRSGSLLAALDLSADWALTAGAALADRGQGGLGEFFDPDGPPARGSRLGGTVERQREIEAGGAWTPRDGVAAGLAWGYRWTENAGHQPGRDREGWFGRVSLTLRR